MSAAPGEHYRGGDPCAVCFVRVPAKQVVNPHTGQVHDVIPESMYWRGDNGSRFSIVFCSPDCSLKWHTVNGLPLP